MEDEIRNLSDLGYKEDPSFFRHYYNAIEPWNVLGLILFIFGFISVWISYQIYFVIIALVGISTVIFLNLRNYKKGIKKYKGDKAIERKDYKIEDGDEIQFHSLYISHKYKIYCKCHGYSSGSD